MVVYYFNKNVALIDIKLCVFAQHDTIMVGAIGKGTHRCRWTILCVLGFSSNCLV